MRQRRSIEPLWVATALMIAAVVLMALVLAGCGEKAEPEAPLAEGGSLPTGGLARGPLRPLQRDLTIAGFASQPITLDGFHVGHKRRVFGRAANPRHLEAGLSIEIGRGAKAHVLLYRPR